MPIVEWNDGYSVGIAQFDEHHRHLMNQLNSAFDNFVACASPEALEALLDELADYATYHFAAEEAWMREQRYPGFAEHKREHARFATRVAEVRKDYAMGRKPLFLEILSFLKNWLTGHILSSDAEYGRFAVGNRPGAAIGSPVTRKIESPT